MRDLLASAVSGGEPGSLIGREIGGLALDEAVRHRERIQDPFPQQGLVGLTRDALQEVAQQSHPQVGIAHGAAPFQVGGFAAPQEVQELFHTVVGVGIKWTGPDLKV